MEKKNKMLDECKGRGKRFCQFFPFPIWGVSFSMWFGQREKNNIRSCSGWCISYWRCISQKSSKHSNLTHISQHHKKKTKDWIHKNEQLTKFRWTNIPRRKGRKAIQVHGLWQMNNKNYKATTTQLLFLPLFRKWWTTSGKRIQVLSPDDTPTNGQ